MSPREPWEELLDAEEEYLGRRMKLFSSGIARNQLELALASPRGVGMALRVLRDAPVEVVMSLFEAVFAAAVRTHPQVGNAREVLGRLDGGWLAVALPPVVFGTLDRPTASWEDYRRTAELLSELGQRALLADVVDRAKTSDDDDMKDVVEDFGE